MPVIRISQDLINKGLTCPPGKTRIEYCDLDLPGLVFSVSDCSNGIASMALRYKNIEGKTSYIKIGRTSDITLVDARKKAKLLKLEIANGSDPSQAKRDLKAVITFDVLFNDYYLPFVMPRKHSWLRDRELYVLRISQKYGSKRLNEVTKMQVQNFQAELLAEGLAPATANHHVKLIRRMLNLAVDWEMLEKNPVSRIAMLAEMNQKERYLSEEELVRLVQVLKTDSCRSVCLIILYLMSTGARLNEVLSATWDQVDRERKIWRIPASNSKSKRLRTVPLNESAFDIINQLETEHKFDHLFINFKTNKKFVSIHKVWHKLRAKAQLPEMRIHDARHFFCSALASSGRSLYEIQTLAGHSDPKTTMRYSSVSSKALHSASSTASDIIQEAFKKSSLASA